MTASASSPRLSGKRRAPSLPRSATRCSTPLSSTPWDAPSNSTRIIRRGRPSSSTRSKIERSRSPRCWSCIDRRAPIPEVFRQVEVEAEICVFMKAKAEPALLRRGAMGGEACVSEAELEGGRRGGAEVEEVGPGSTPVGDNDDLAAGLDQAAQPDR